MICPHCNKIIQSNGFGSKIKIIEALKVSPKIIRELQNITKLSKTNLLHHLKKMSKDKIISIEKKEHERGQPSLVTFNREYNNNKEIER